MRFVFLPLQAQSLGKVQYHSLSENISLEIQHVHPVFRGLAWIKNVSSSVSSFREDTQGPP